MRSSLVKAFVIAAVCAFAVTVAAQDKPPAGGGQAKEHTMSGCLQKGSVEGTYVVQSSAEKGPKMIGILQSKDNLAPHVGHTIDITGTAVPAEEAKTMKDAPKADHYMNITAIKMVAPSCK
jgi:hypothetical protein